MKTSFLKQMSRVTRLVGSGQLVQATHLIQKALGTIGGTAAMPKPPIRRRPPVGIPPVIVAPAMAREVVEPIDVPHPRSDSPTPSGREGLFESGYLHENGLQGRYKVFVPADLQPQAALVVMLHGCTQTPDDFAAGTDMNRRAAEQGFVVLYPAQSSNANPSGCWNWFRPVDQKRDSGEPALIAAMTRAMVAEHRIDPKRVFIAGLSAGGAMAAIVAGEYPELFAAVGIHSGLAAGAARNLPDALSAMRTGGTRGAGASTTTASVPTIVFHGDADRTVHVDNGRRAIDAATRAAGDAIVTTGTSHAGRTYTRSTYAGPDGATVAEYWVLHDAAHAWSGGNARGSYTDASGPSASDEMLRFFFERGARR